MQMAVAMDIGDTAVPPEGGLLDHRNCSSCHDIRLTWWIVTTSSNAISMTMRRLASKNGCVGFDIVSIKSD
jgi:hypothetical protein